MIYLAVCLRASWASCEHRLGFFDDLIFQPLGAFDFGVAAKGHHPALNLNGSLGVKADFHAPVFEGFYFLFRVPLPFEDRVGNFGVELDGHTKRFVVSSKLGKRIGEFLFGIEAALDIRFLAE